ncbi:MAG TPA: tyrosine-type recombinase/integrase [Acidimicrobiales bacterium]|jgi:integrase
MREKRKGYWELRVDAGTDPVTHRRRQISRGFQGGQRAAEAALRALASEVDAGRHRGTEATFGALLEAWYGQAVDSWSPTTTERVRSLIDRHLAPALGDTPLSKLGAAQLDALYRRLRSEGLSPATVRKVHNVAHRALNQALRWQWLAANPAAAASPPAVHDAEIRPPPSELARELVALADKTNPELAAFLRISAATGARRGEICALRHSDFDGQSLLFARAAVRDHGRTVIKGTKTNRERRIALDPLTASMLAAQAQRQRDRARDHELELIADPYLFADVTGEHPWSPNSVSLSFGRLRRTLGAKGVRLHDLRHLHATELLAAGVPVKTVAGRLGHARASMTHDRYGHWVPASDRDAADIIGQILAEPKHDEGAPE